MPAVSSSAVKRVDYDEENRELLVTFIDGDSYAYQNVPLHVFDELLSAASIGAYVNRRIKPNYEARQVARRRSKLH
jgi:hypothetical protein